MNTFSFSIANASVDLLISDQLPPTRIISTRSPGPSMTVPTKHDIKDFPRTLKMPASTRQPTAPPTTTQQTTPTTKPAPTAVKTTIQSTTSIQPTTQTPTTTKLTPTSQQTTTTTTTTQPPWPVTQHKSSPSDTNISPPIDVSPTAASRQGSKTRLSWTESPADQPKTTKKPGTETYSTMSSSKLIIYLVVSVHVFSREKC